MAGVEGLLISESHFMKSSSMYTVNEHIDERPWIRGGSSSAVSYLLQLVPCVITEASIALDTGCKSMQ